MVEWWSGDETKGEVSEVGEKVGTVDMMVMVVWSEGGGKEGREGRSEREKVDFLLFIILEEGGGRFYSSSYGSVILICAHTTARASCPGRASERGRCGEVTHTTHTHTQVRRE